MNYLEMKDLILLNQYIQEIRSKTEIGEWFLSFDESDKRVIVKAVWSLARQALVREEDISRATNQAGLKSSHTPIVMLSSSKF